MAHSLNYLSKSFPKQPLTSKSKLREHEMRHHQLFVRLFSILKSMSGSGCFFEPLVNFLKKIFLLRRNWWTFPFLTTSPISRFCRQLMKLVVLCPHNYLSFQRQEGIMCVLQIFFRKHGLWQVDKKDLFLFRLFCDLYISCSCLNAKYEYIKIKIHIELVCFKDSTNSEY